MRNIKLSDYIHLGLIFFLVISIISIISARNNKEKELVSYISTQKSNTDLTYILRQTKYKNFKIVLEKDLGGHLKTYIDNISAIKNKFGVLLILNGECYSACTMYLSLPPEKICTTENTDLYFHSPRYSPPDVLDMFLRNVVNKERISVYEDKFAKHILTYYPKKVLTVIKENGGLKKDQFIKLTASKYIRTCSEYELKNTKLNVR